MAPVWFSVPPTGYGGIELVVSLLADGFADAGHDVTLFAAGGSRTRAHLVETVAAPPDPTELGNPWFDAHHAVTAYAAITDGGFDIVHDHSGIAGPACGSLLRDAAVVHTLHGPWTPHNRAFYAAIAGRVHLVAISDAQRAANTEVSCLGTVHNGIDLDAYRVGTEKDDSLVYIGRANPDKGPAEAIEIARRAGRPLRMILKRSEPAEREYFEQAVAPLLGPDVTLHENVSHDVKVDLLGRAAAMIFPIRWPEPFGLVMAEALACGTPVVTTDWGAAPEIVDDGVTGFRRDSTDDLVAAVGRVGEIDPAACRRRAEERFSGPAMVRGYEQLFTGLVAGTANPSPFPLPT